jgi:hypothetical protein
MVLIHKSLMKEAWKNFIQGMNGMGIKKPGV